jgi:hypothetical protein
VTFLSKCHYGVEKNDGVKRLEDAERTSEVADTAARSIYGGWDAVVQC